MKKLLLTGFTPFGAYTVNSSQVMVNLIEQCGMTNFDIRSIILPVSFSQSFQKLKNEIDTFNPDLVISLGLAEMRPSINLEKVAINLIDCKTPDNEGIHMRDQLILKDGPTAYFSNLNTEEMRSVQTSFPVEMSYSAGTFVCNFIMYQTLSYLHDSKVKAGFIHLPHLENQEGKILDTLLKIIPLA